LFELIKSDWDTTDHRPKIRKSRKYICFHCGGTFTADWTEEEALEELKRDYPGVSQENCEVICDDCYKQFVKWKNDLIEK
jgi:5-methylcytosine-specific restriction endonuclease McrA